MYFILVSFIEALLKINLLHEKENYWILIAASLVAENTSSDGKWAKEENFVSKNKL